MVDRTPDHTRQSEPGALTAGPGNLSMTLVGILLQLAGDARITRASTIHTAVLLGRYAAEHGCITASGQGWFHADTQKIGATLGYAPSSVASAFTDLDSLGYIEYRRPTGNERRHGIRGKVRFIIPPSQMVED
jgi:hypothetical protein